MATSTWCFCHKADIYALADAYRPATLAELSEINGVGETKLAKYGESLLEVLAAAGAA